MRILRWKELEGKQGHCHAAVTRLSPRVLTAKHRHDFHEMFLVLKGSGFHHRAGKKIPLRAGHLVFVRPEDTHHFGTGAGENLDFVNVAVSARWLKNLGQVVALPGGWEGAGEPRGHFLPGRETDRQLRRLIFRLMEASCAPHVLVEAWSQAIRAATEAPASSGAPPPWLEALRRDLERPEWMGEDLAFWQKRSGRSPEHLARCCRRFYDAPLNELVNRARIARARFLLQTTDEKVTTVAFEAGYNNLAHFYRVFERLTGDTPQAWRRRAAQSAVPAATPFGAGEKIPAKSPRSPVRAPRA